MSKKILVIDDSPVIGQVISAALSKSYDVCCIDSAPEGLEKYDEIRPSILFLDIMMPEMDGYEVLERLKDHPHDCEIIIITALPKDKVLENLSGHEGVRKILEKPFNLPQLIDIVTILLGDISDRIEEQLGMLEEEELERRNE